MIPPLAVEWFGSGPAIAFLHGFTQTGESWRAVAEPLADRYRIALVDLPGHGRSAGLAASLEEAAALIATAIGPAVYVGYSLGGRHALHVALARPELVTGLVLVGATAGIEDPAAQAQRRRDDGVLAQHLLEIGVERFLDEWLAGPLFRTLSPEAADREDRLRNRAEGLASSLRTAGAGRQAPSWARLPELRMPALVVAGAEDEKFRALGERMVHAWGGPATLRLIEEAGHSAHREQPERFTEVLTAFLDEVLAA